MFYMFRKFFASIGDKIKKDSTSPVREAAADEEEPAAIFVAAKVTKYAADIKSISASRESIAQE